MCLFFFVGLLKCECKQRCLVRVCVCVCDKEAAGPADESSPLLKPRIVPCGLLPRPWGQMDGFVCWEAGQGGGGSGGSVCIKLAAAQAGVVNTPWHTDAHSQGRVDSERKWDSGASSRHLSHPSHGHICFGELSNLAAPRSDHLTLHV